MNLELLAKQKKYAKNNRKKIADAQRKYRKLNAHKVFEYQKKYRKDNEEKLSEYKREYHKKHHKKIRARSRKYHKDNPEKISEYRRQYYQKNRLIALSYSKCNRNRINKRRNEIRKNNPLARLRCVLRASISQAFRFTGFKKDSLTKTILGCDYQMAKFHIESQFESWMTWGNYGEWEIDHIIPLSRATTIKGLYFLCNYRNLQPLLKFTNRSKSDNVRKEDIEKIYINWKLSKEDRKILNKILDSKYFK